MKPLWESPEFGLVRGDSNGRFYLPGGALISARKGECNFVERLIITISKLNVLANNKRGARLCGPR